MKKIVSIFLVVVGIIMLATCFGDNEEESTVQDWGESAQTEKEAESGAENSDYVKFKNIWLEHNATKGEEKGMYVHIEFDISDMEGQECTAIAFFDHPKGTGVEDKNGRYCTSDGHVSASQKFTPSNQNTTYSDLKIFIPISELHLLPGKETYYTRVFIQSPNGKFLGHSDFTSFEGTGASDNSENKQNATNYQGETWREELGNGMFAINQGNRNGAHQRTIYRLCPNCHGTTVCRNCNGSKICQICGGRGGITTSGYGRYIPCTACNQGRCGICNGTGSCICTTFDHPGYIPGSTIIIGPDGKVVYNSRDYDNGSSSSSSSQSSRQTTRGACPKCGGRKYEPESYEYAAASTHGWAQPYHNSLGDKCPYCGYASDHYHYACSECHGTGHN